MRDEQPDDLVAEERVALGHGREAADEVVRGVGAGAVGDEAPQVVVLEAAEVDAPPEAAQLAEDPLDLGAAARAGVVVRGDHEHGDVGERAGEEREQQERRQVGGVEVVEEDDDGRVRRDPPQEHADGVEEGEAGLLGLGGGLARLGEPEPVADLGRDLRDPARPGAEVRGEAVVGAFGGERAHDLQPRPVGGRAAAVPAARQRDDGPGAPRLVAERPRQPGLADPRLAREQHETAASRARLLERPHQLIELAPPPEQRQLTARGDGVRAVHLECPHTPGIYCACLGKATSATGSVARPWPRRRSRC